MLWYAIKWLFADKSHLFTYQDYAITPQKAFSLLYGSDCKLLVMYKCVPFNKLISNIYTCDKNIHKNTVLCGYISDSDTFVFLEYEDNAELDQYCCICLDELNHNQPIRVYGERCFHDMHIECYEKRPRFPCCKYNTTLTTHYTLKSIILSKYNSLSGWKDIHTETCELNQSPSQITKSIKNTYASFVPYCLKPYFRTVDIYHRKWLKNKVHPSKL